METEKYKCGMCKSYYKPTLKPNNNIYKTCDRCRNITKPKTYNNETIQDLQKKNAELIKQIEELKPKAEILNIEPLPKRDEKLELFLKAFQENRK